MARFFDPENGLWHGVGRFTDLLIVNVMWLIFSIPIVTIGPATAALYDASVRCVRYERGTSFSRFWTVFRREFKTGILACIAWEVVLYVWFAVLRLAWSGVEAGEPLARLYLMLIAVLMIIPVGAFCWMFPLLSRFTFSTGGLIKTGLRFALGKLPWTILMVVTVVGTVLLSFLYFVPLLFLPCLVCILWSFWLERIFRKIDPAASLVPDEAPLDEEEE